jgi:2-polyprenyl-3-methyl-5-hydroxy-6-metoxy-1,4-benzoquinol methylase
MTIEEALKVIRKELIIKDEPLKAFNLLKRFEDEHGVKLPTEMKNTEVMIAHYFNPKDHDFAYNENMSLDNHEQIEGIEYATDAGKRYWRYQWILDNLENAKSYMDMGCYVGSVVTTASLRGIKSIGVDATRKSIEIARRRAKDVGADCEFFIDDVTTFNKRKAEHVSSMEVIEHVNDPKAYAKHLADLATKWVYVSTPNGPYGNGEGNLPNWDLRGPTDRRGHLVVFTKHTLEKMLEDMEIDQLIEGEDGLLHVKYRRSK